MGVYSIPSVTYPWSDWTLTNVSYSDAESGYLTATVPGGTAISPDFLAGSTGTDIWYYMAWKTNNDPALLVEYKVATTQTGLTGASWTVVNNNSVLSTVDRLSYIRVRITFGATEFFVTNVSITYEAITHNNEMAFGTDGLNPTKDGKFRGRKITCAVCGQMLRKAQGRKQRGKWVHSDRCYDKRIPKKRGG